MGNYGLLAAAIATATMILITTIGIGQVDDVHDRSSFPAHQPRARQLSANIILTIINMTIV